MPARVEDEETIEPLGDEEQGEQRPHNAYHYETLKDVPKDIQKYWQQRYDIFTRYDDGVWLTDDAWFGVTPESVAEAIAADIAATAPKSKTVLIDAFAGVGGNAIAFARSGRWDRIFAVEKEPDVLQCAKHNAAIYGVDKKIWWIEGDIFKAMKTHFKGMGDSAVIFASPPWGGPGYRSDAIFNLETMQPYNIYDLYEPFAKVSKELVLYLPRTSDLNQLAALAKTDRQLPVTHYCMRGASKALCVYFGDLAEDEQL